MILDRTIDWHARFVAAAFVVATIPFAHPVRADERRPFQWPAGQKGAVTLSYDDAIPSHFQSVAPQLEKAGLRGTFYIQADSGGFRTYTEQWRRVAQAGHELGNHSLHHPCRKDRPGQHTWLADDYNLSNYSAERWLAEMRMANLILYLVDGKTFEQLRAEIEAEVAKGQWIFYMFHGVGQGTHSLYIDAEEHRQLIEYLGANKDRIWTAPAVEIATYLKGFQHEKN